jgi:phage baseplate assembly protein W
VKNLAVPFRRDARDFATASGGDLLLAKAEQVLATEADSPSGAGELPWRSAFGSLLHLLRHRPNDDVLAELGRVRARDALARWLPSARVTGCAPAADGDRFTLRIALTEAAQLAATADVTVALGPVGPE